MGRLYIVIFLSFLVGCGFDANIQDLKSQLSGESDSDGGVTVTPTPAPVQQTVSTIINQNATQSDPTSNFPIKFIISFVDPIDPTTIDNTDVQFTGTAGTVSYNVVPVGDDKNFYVEVTSTSQLGTIQLDTTPLNVLTPQGVRNDTPVIVDNSVALIAPAVPYMFKNLNSKQAGTDFDLISKYGTDLVNFSFGGVTSKAVNLQTKAINTISNTKATFDAYDYVGEISGIVFYRGYLSDSGSELWRTDGTNAGTYLVKDLYPGVDSSSPKFQNEYFQRGIAQFNPPYNGYVYFIADDADGSKIWRTNGTSAGTEVFFSAGSGRSQGHYEIIGELGGKFYFAASTAANGYELYYTLGTIGDQVMIEFRSGTTSGFSPGFGSAQPVLQNGKMYFSCDKGASTGLEPCVSDGTFAGTTVIKDVFGGSVGSYSRSFYYNNDILLLSGNTNISGTVSSLWVSDGTSANTFMHPIYGSNYDGVIALNQLDYSGKDYVYLVHIHETLGYQLYIAKPEASGFVLLKDLFEQDTTGYSFDKINRMAMNNNKLIFIAETASEGAEIWATDGTVGGTSIVKDINPGSASGVQGHFTFEENILAFNNELYFVGITSAGGRELWKSDGTSSGTVMVKDIAPGALSSNPKDFFIENGYLYFTADDGVHGTELWRTDGTTAGTVLYIDFTVGELTPGDPYNFTEFNGKLYFMGSDSNLGQELFVSDGTFANTEVLYDFNPGAGDSFIQAVFKDDNKLIVVPIDNSTGHPTLFISDGTNSGTNILNSDFGVNGWSLAEITDNNFSFFFGSNSSTQLGLWRSNYTIGGTYELSTSIVIDFSGFTYPTGKFQGKYLFEDQFSDNWLVSDGTVPGTVSFINTAYELDESYETSTGLYFKARNATVGRELFKFDGTSITVAHDIRSGTGHSAPRILGVINDELILVAANSATEAALYKTDGTTLTKLKVIHTTMTNANIGDSIIKNNKIYFSAKTAAEGQELWVTDGSVAGSGVLKDLNVGTGNSSPGDFFETTTGFYFTASNGSSGSELWFSDGTVAGTTLIKDINPGATGSSISSFMTVGSRVFFVADDGTHGAEIWSTNGTTAGTTLYYDLATGAASYDPALQYLFGDQLFFTADKPGEGRELWVIPDVN